MIMNQDTWRQWNELVLINLLINMKKAKLPINIERETSHKIRNHLNKIYHFKLKPYYLIRIPTMRLDIRNQLKAWIKHYTNQHYTDAYSSYVANHTKIIMESTIKLGNLIDNTKRILRNYSHKNNKETCYCEHYPELRRAKEHINIKAQDLPNSWLEVKNLLTTSKKTPILLPYHTFLGISFDRIRTFLNQNQLYRKWSSLENEKLFRIFYRPKPKQETLTLDNVETIMKPLRNIFGFIPLDKNNNTWSIVCKYNYIQLHQKEFNNTNYYELVKLQPKTLMKKIEQQYKEEVITKYKHKINTNRRWELSHAYLLPKNKDTDKTRPIVSYFHHFSKTLGEKIARALTVMIKTLTIKWDTCEMHNINMLNTLLQPYKNSKTWQEAIKNKKVTLMKFDIKSQFTNLNKDRVMKALEYGLEYLRTQTTRKLCFCIRNRKYERRYDHIGHPQKYKEIGILPDLVLAYIKYELDTSFFQINGTCYRQKNGLPMGGFNSAPLACLDAMVQEHQNANLLRGRIKIRYRDDILMILPRILDEDAIHKQHNKLNKIYGPDLTVELEGYSYNKMNFLEFTLLFNLETHHYNKNYNISTQKMIIRYPAATAEYPTHIMLGTIIGTIIGTMKRTINRASTLHLKILSCIMTTLEFIQLKYNTHLIATALNFSGLPIMLIQELRKILRSCSH